jgi:hypothetical protein
MEPMGRLSMHSKCLYLFLLSFEAVWGRIFFHFFVCVGRRRVRFFFKCPLCTLKVDNHFSTCIVKGEG